MKVTILGCGTSSGVPRIGNDWGACDPDQLRNARMRSAAVVEAAGFALLIDTPPDLRSQMLATGVHAIDAVFWTHDHADHCHGIDDLRAVFHARRAPIPGYACARTMASLNARFAYVFAGNAGYPATVAIHDIADTPAIGPFAIATVEQPHGPVSSTGIRVSHDGRSVGYAIDFSAVTDAMVALFTGVDLLIVDCLRARPHPTHADQAMAMDLITRTGAKSALLTHMDNSMDYDTLCAALPPHIRPAHDGQVVML